MEAWKYVIDNIESLSNIFRLMYVYEMQDLVMSFRTLHWVMDMDRVHD